ncbi:hypothetical protein HMPREF1486_01668 [Streptomyces sp. HPH0547]|nr:hypothetical protein HMPREF1486_01668 [Streptomyces sp. HPH0547]
MPLGGGETAVAAGAQPGGGAPGGDGVAADREAGARHVQLAAVRGEGERHGAVASGGQGPAERLVRGGVPQAYGALPAGDGEGAAVRGEGQGGDRFGAAAGFPVGAGEQAEAASAAAVPEGDAAGAVTGGQDPAVGAEGEGVGLVLAEDPPQHSAGGG